MSVDRVMRTDSPAARSEAIAAALGALGRGEPVAVPTDTVYGLAADAANARAVRELFELKERPEDRGIAVLVADLAAAETLVELTWQARRLAQRCWPGPLTIVAARMPEAPPHLGIGDTIGVRLPDDEILRAIAGSGPLAVTSANLHAGSTPTHRPGSGRTVPDPATRDRRRLPARQFVHRGGCHRHCPCGPSRRPCQPQRDSRRGPVVNVLGLLGALPSRGALDPAFNPQEGLSQPSPYDESKQRGWGNQTHDPDQHVEAQAAQARPRRQNLVGTDRGVRPLAPPLPEAQHDSPGAGAHHRPAFSHWCPRMEPYSRRRHVGLAPCALLSGRTMRVSG